MPIKIEVLITSWKLKEHHDKTACFYGHKNQKWRKKRMSKKATPSWVQQESAKIKEQQAKESQFFKLPEGETEVLIDDTQPPEVLEKTFKSDTRTRWQYKVVLEDGEQKTLEVGKQLHRLIIKALLQGLNPMTIIRAGTDINTKYGIKALMK